MASKTVDDYIAQSAWPTELARLREVLLQESLTEDVKWGMPYYSAEEQNVVALVGFKSYFGLWFSQGALLEDPDEVLINAQQGKTQAQRQWRMTSAEEICDARVRRYVRDAIELARTGAAVPQKRVSGESAVPAALAAALQEDARAARAFAALRPAQRREYSAHVSDAKRTDTQVRRVAKILPMILAGNGLNDRYRR